ncbi:O-methyltransferase [Natrinema zhouii]|uniref:O-methyltransferase n=1 Tax=Natrinema zhouii TaxID=1710539 RepID=UPI001CFF771E|nr:class I SAM-dependent methyltransferase [Natrinema zhouii]
MGLYRTSASIGPDIGAWLCQLARITDATRVFEFGSGYGYSACWFARALPDDGEIVLTEGSSENLERARTYLERLDAADLATFEVGDAVETASQYDGPFEIALLDIEKYQYVNAFEAIRESIPPGGMVIADNTMSAGRDAPDDTVDFEVLLAALTGEIVDIQETELPEETKKHTAGILEYLTHVRESSAFESTLLPLGDGVTVTTRTR